MEWLRGWRRRRVLRRSELDPGLWRATLERYGFLRALSPEERERLRERVLLFLHEKSMHGARGLVLREDMRVAIAAQACILILNLDIDFYRGWVDIIVYPDEFVAEYEYTDEDGVVHKVRQPTTGESWGAGPLILSWADAGELQAGTGYNVVIHEFAHKIDMLNGDADGFPPLHADMERSEWTQVFTGAYEDFCAALERGEETAIDPYAAEHPSEFFAVMSEAFFDLPAAMKTRYPGVYAQLSRFYRQDPAARLARAADADAALRAYGRG
jgi:Mlc titration factor MtfA (ptsG expression regulator)